MNSKSTLVRNKINELIQTPGIRLHVRVIGQFDPDPQIVKSYTDQAFGMSTHDDLFVSEGTDVPYCWLTVADLGRVDAFIAKRFNHTIHFILRDLPGSEAFALAATAR